MPNSTRRSKDCWHTMSLQQLTPNHFARVVNAILTERFTLVPSCLDTPRETTRRAHRRPSTATA